MISPVFQVTVYKSLRTILDETDENAFERMLLEFNVQLNEDNDTREFGEYFINQYMSNTSSWAYCSRIGAGINTNMHLERIHCTLKYTYLKGKHVKRLDKGINAIMRLVRDKCIERLITLNKGKISSNLSAIRLRHKTSMNLKLNLISPCENGWKVASQRNTDLYLIRQVKILANVNLCVQVVRLVYINLSALA